MMQLVEKAFGERELPRIVWQNEKNGEISYRDPFREEVEFRSIEEYEEDYSRHIKACREALLQCEVFVITLGVNEAWQMRIDGSVLSRAPWRTSPSLVNRRVLSVADNVHALN